MNNSGTQDRRLLALAAAGRRFAVMSDLDELWGVATVFALEVLKADSASLGRIEHEAGVLRILRNVGDLADWEHEVPDDEFYDVSDFPSIAVAAEDATPWTGSLDEDIEPVHAELLVSMRMHSAIELPVVVGSRVWGEISAARRQGRAPFAQADVAAGEAFSGLLAAAIVRISEREQLHALAYRDGLTGLGNRRWLDERLEALFLTDPMPVPAAVILCDVDGLKKVNDVHGHDAGDRLLRTVASLLTQIAGKFPDSLAARLGGDEFCLLLEGVTESEVQAATDWLTDAASALPMGSGLSCGWAFAHTRPGGATTAVAATRALLRLADAAQYRAKRAGRESMLATPSATRTTEATSLESVHMADAVLVALAIAGDDVTDRLAVIGSEMGQILDTTGWAVSLSVDGGPVTIVRAGDGRHLTQPLRDQSQPMTQGAAWDLQDYPATAAALVGGSFHATIDSGEPSERAFLAASGYDEIIGAGATEGGGRAWLVELVGDALSAPLAPHRGLLRVLVESVVRDVTFDTMAGIETTRPRLPAERDAVTPHPG